jgi:hypothetical protein
MAILDEVLADIMLGLKSDLTEVGLRKQRGGIARGVGWAEASGYAADGGWLELRLHHRPTEHRLQAGLLAYQPLARGARTTVVGECELHYQDAPQEVAHHLADDVSDWLRRLAHEARAASVPAVAS